MQVYLIQNLVNGKCYVGQHSGENLNRYLKKNIGEALRGSTIKRFLYNAIRKHGADSFTIQCLAKCESKREMDSVEQAYIKLFGTQNEDLGYNITSGGGGLLGVKRSDYTKRKLSKAAKGNKRCVGRVVSEETKAKMRAAALGNRYCVGRKHSPETLEKLRVAALGNKRGKKKVRSDA